jgi:hypothetical protein
MGICYHLSLFFRAELLIAVKDGLGHQGILVCLGSWWVAGRHGG